MILSTITLRLDPRSTTDNDACLMRRSTKGYSYDRLCLTSMKHVASFKNEIVCFSPSLDRHTSRAVPKTSISPSHVQVIWSIIGNTRCRSSDPQPAITLAVLRAVHFTCAVITLLISVRLELPNLGVLPSLGILLRPFDHCGVRLFLF